MTQRAHRAFDPSLLILPAFALLILLFVIPLVWFFVGVLAEEGSVGAVVERFVDVLSAPGIVNALVATNWISALVTALTLVIGYPIAYYLANSTGWRFALVLFCIIVPYFTSVIVRTYSWMVLLGRNGAINQTLLSLGIIDAPLQLLYNKMGVLIGMTYVLMPYMVLTLYATMRAIDTNLVRAAYGLGASPLYTFRKVYFPLSLHGVISGALIVFILAIGFLHHAGADGRAERRDDRDADRARGRDHARLDERGHHVDGAAGDDARALCHLLSRHRRPTHDGGVRRWDGQEVQPYHSTSRLACLLLMVPILIVCVLAFSGEGYLRFPPNSFSLRWFAAFFGDTRWRQSLSSSLIIALIACVISTVLGFFAAYAFVRGDFRAKKIVLSVLLIPIIVPHVITAIAMYFMTAKFGLIGNVVWIGFCHAVVTLPIVVLILLSSLQGVDINLERAGLSLGGSRVYVFRRVVIPLAFPGIMSSALFAFLASFDELIISLFLAGVRAQTLPVRIWNSLHLELEPVIAAVSAFLIAVTGVVLLFDMFLRSLRAAKATGKNGST